MLIKNYVVMTAITIVLMSGLVSSTLYVFGVPPKEGFLGSQDCKLGGTKGGMFPVTCCWHDDKTQTNYCQTCVFVYSNSEGNGSYQDCNEPEIQMLDIPPNNPPASPKGPSVPIQDEGVLEQPDNPNKGSVMNLPNSGERTLDN